MCIYATTYRGWSTANSYGWQLHYGTYSEVRTYVWSQKIKTLSVDLLSGKRYNVLRHRVDSWSYDLDQLLLGTILFTLTAFISPTTFTYYVLFAIVRLSPNVALRCSLLSAFSQSQLITFMVVALLNVALVLVNQFPLFALLLRIKDPARLPGTYMHVAVENMLKVCRWYRYQFKRRRIATAATGMALGLRHHLLLTIPFLE